MLVRNRLAHLVLGHAGVRVPLALGVAHRVELRCAYDIARLVAAAAAVELAETSGRLQEHTRRRVARSIKED